MRAAQIQRWPDTHRIVSSSMDPLLVLTIGQAPRLDIARELADVLGERPLEVRGALDGYDDATIDALVPINAADVLHTRLASGRDAVISKRAVTERMADLIDDAGSRPTLVACTGRFDGLPDRPNLLFPSVVLAGLVDAVLPHGHRLGVMVPLPEQIVPMADSWRSPERPVTAVAVKPGEDVASASAELRTAGVDLVVLDCFGYDTATLNSVRAVTGRPVLSAVRCAAHLASELLG
jgi:protein AroM